MTGSRTQLLSWRERSLQATKRGPKQKEFPMVLEVGVTSDKSLFLVMLNKLLLGESPEKQLKYIEELLADAVIVAQIPPRIFEVLLQRVKTLLQSSEDRKYPEILMRFYGKLPRVPDVRKGAFCSSELMVLLIREILKSWVPFKVAGDQHGLVAKTCYSFLCDAWNEKVYGQLEFRKEIEREILDYLVQEARYWRWEDLWQWIGDPQTPLTLVRVLFKAVPRHIEGLPEISKRLAQFVDASRFQDLSPEAVQILSDTAESLHRLQASKSSSY